MIPGLHSALLAAGGGLSLYYELNSSGLASGATRTTSGLTVPTYSRCQIIVGTTTKRVTKTYNLGESGAPVPGQQLSFTIGFETPGSNYSASNWNTSLVYHNLLQNGTHSQTSATGSPVSETISDTLYRAQFYYS